MPRTTIRLTDEQHSAVKRLAAEDGVSISEVIRRCTAAYLALDEARRRTLSAIGALKGGPRDLSERHDHYFAEAIEADLPRNRH